MHTVQAVSVEDLRLLTILCVHCGTRVTLDLDSTFPPESPHRPFTCPTDCPRCGNLYDSAIPGAVNGMQKVYKAFALRSSVVSFAAAPPSAPSAKP